MGLGIYSQTHFFVRFSVGQPPTVLFERKDNSFLKPGRQNLSFVGTVVLVGVRLFPFISLSHE